MLSFPYLMTKLLNQAFRAVALLLENSKILLADEPLFLEENPWIKQVRRRIGIALYDRENDCYRTARVNDFFALSSEISRFLAKKGKGGKRCQCIAPQVMHLKPKVIDHKMEGHGKGEDKKPLPRCTSRYPPYPILPYTGTCFCLVLKPRTPEKS